jgi:hypothetical protein
LPCPHTGSDKSQYELCEEVVGGRCFLALEREIVGFGEPILLVDGLSEERISRREQALGAELGTECYGPQASATTKRLLPAGTRVRLYPEPATDRVDQYKRLLRYVVRVKDGLNVNVQLVRVGAAAPYFYLGRRGRYATLLERLALRARARSWACGDAVPTPPYDPTKGVSTRR